MNYNACNSQYGTFAAPTNIRICVIQMTLIIRIIITCEAVSVMWPWPVVSVQVVPVAAARRGKTPVCIDIVHARHSTDIVDPSSVPPDFDRLRHGSSNSPRGLRQRHSQSSSVQHDDRHSTSNKWSEVWHQTSTKWVSADSQTTLWGQVSSLAPLCGQIIAEGTTDLMQTS